MAAEPDSAPQPPNAGPSYGPMSERHWSRARRDSNREAIDYYRERSKAPGVAEGGAERNFYCMRCDGVIAYTHADPNCPHCGEPIDEHVKRYFNWVEINEPPPSDFLPLLKLGSALLGTLAAVGALLWWWLA
jgi:ribosomal protein L37E